MALLAACAVATATHAQTTALTLTLTSRTMQPGEAVVATVSAPQDTTSLVVTAFGSEWPVVRTSTGIWRAVFGIDLDTLPGSYPVLVRSTGSTVVESTGTVIVEPKRFRRRVLRVAPRFVNPPPETVTRIQAEATMMAAIYASRTPDARWAAGFVRPVSEPANSSFGTRSVFNGEARSPHAGTDFLSPSGTPVHAPAAGQVVVARDLYFTGNTVVLDHGHGVVSMLAHLSRIDVREGQEIAGGDVVGAVGATGRVTGPHLHWALRIGPARVDALSALAMLPVDR